MGSTDASIALIRTSPATPTIVRRRRALDVLGDLVAVSGAKEQRSQNEHVQGALKQFDPVGRSLCHIVGRYSTTKSRPTVEFDHGFWLALFFDSTVLRRGPEVVLALQ